MLRKISADSLLLLAEISLIIMCLPRVIQAHAKSDTSEFG